MSTPELIYVYNLDGTKRGPLGGKGEAGAADPTDVQIEQRLQGDEILRFTLRADDPKAEWVAADHRVDYAGIVWRVAPVVDERPNRGGATVQFECHARWYELADVIHTGTFTRTSVSVSAGATAILAGSGWTLAAAPSTGAYSLTQDDASTLELLRAWATVTGTEIAFDTAAKTVTFATRVGTVRASALRYGRNLAGIKRTFRPPQVTRLYPRGANTDTGTLTIGPANGGVDYLEDFSWYTGQGLTLVQARDLYTKAAIWSDTRFQLAANLKDAGRAQLDFLAQPVVTYECKVVDLAALTSTPGDDWRIGDTVRVSDPALSIDVATRVVRVVRYPAQPAKNEIELSYLPKGIRNVNPVPLPDISGFPVVDPVYVLPSGSISSSGVSGIDCGNWALGGDGSVIFSGDMSFFAPSGCPVSASGDWGISSGDWSFLSGSSVTFGSGASAGFAAGSTTEFDPGSVVIVQGTFVVEPPSDENPGGRITSNAGDLGCGNWELTGDGTIGASGDVVFAPPSGCAVTLKGDLVWDYDIGEDSIPVGGAVMRSVHYEPDECGFLHTAGMIEENRPFRNRIYFEDPTEPLATTCSGSPERAFVGIEQPSNEFVVRSIASGTNRLVRLLTHPASGKGELRLGSHAAAGVVADGAGGLDLQGSPVTVNGSPIGSGGGGGPVFSFFDYWSDTPSPPWPVDETVTYTRAVMAVTVTPSADADIEIQVNGSTVETVTFPTGGTTATVTGLSVAVVPGDVIVVILDPDEFDAIDFVMRLK